MHWIKEGEKLKKYIELNGSENRLHEYLWGVTKAVLKGKLKLLHAYIGKAHHLNSYLKNLEK